MLNIRNNVFETNSSSSHSISISSESDGLYDTIDLDENANVVLNGGKFGWEEEEYHDALTKANYCAVDVFNDPKKIQMLKDVIKKHTGARKVIINFTTDYNSENYSYIDHQSRGTSAEAFSSEKNLKRFLFRHNSVLHTGNDNC